MLSSLSDMIKLSPEIFSHNWPYSLLPIFSRTNLKLLDIPIIPNMVKKVKTGLNFSMIFLVVFQQFLLGWHSCLSDCWKTLFCSPCVRVLGQRNVTKNSCPSKKCFSSFSMVLGFLLQLQVFQELYLIGLLGF